MEIDEIIKLYNDGSSLKELSQLLKITAHSVKQLLIKNNVKIRTAHQQTIFTNMKRKKYVNDNYFDNIGVNQAWLMGFIASDGTIRKENNSIKIGLAGRDIEILEKIKKELKIERNINTNITNNGFDVCQIEWSSFKHKQFLAQYGIIPRKTYSGIHLPNWSDKNNILAFILGYFDGDGSISFHKTGSWSWSIVSYKEDILKEIKDFLNSAYNIPSQVYKEKNGKLYELNLRGGKNNIIKLMNEMYNLNSLHLERKYKKFQELLNNINHEATASVKDEKIC